MLNISKTQNGNPTILAVKGRLDTITSKKLADEFEELFKSGTNALIIDCASLNYLSSAGLRVLMMAQKRLSTTGGGLIIKNCSETVYEIFKTTGFTNIMQIMT